MAGSYLQSGGRPFFISPSVCCNKWWWTTWSLKAFVIHLAFSFYSMKVNLDQINMLWITHERKTDVATEERKWPGNKRHPRCVCWFLSTFPGLSRRSSQDSPHNSCSLPPSFCPGHRELQPAILKAEGWISIFHLFTTVPWFRRQL